MEDMARLALVEESVRDADKFRKILYELLQHLNNILDNPHDFQTRTIKSNILKEATSSESFKHYMKYLGFEMKEDSFVFPNSSTLSTLRMGQVAVERKINICFGSIDNNLARLRTPICQGVVPRVKPKTNNILSTNNRFLLKIQDLFNNMLVYEDPELLALAREQIPIVTLQLMALDRVREQQMDLKTGKIKGHDLPFDIALLMELLHWFKTKFFSWVDKPACEVCGGTTTFFSSSTMTTPVETCRVEVYKCERCGGVSQFPRHNDLRTLLRTRRGRCGEWANCFTLVCRALGYDARYVYDTTDHVWCEVFDFDSNEWVHADPCEAKINAPLMYCHGWKKRLSYVMAFAKDDLQDVTWRYTMNHKEVLERRREVSEKDLINAILTLRASRQRHLSEARRLYLAKRTVQELVQLMNERKPSDYESQGRSSGSVVWRRQRGELATGYIFALSRPALYVISYYCALDQYRVTCDDQVIDAPTGWANGIVFAKNIRRKVEHDWGKVYLAREEGAAPGSIWWRVRCARGVAGAGARVRVRSATYAAGRLRWAVCFDEPRADVVQLGDIPMEFKRSFRSFTLAAELSGGAGGVAWQHAQLFRQSLHDTSPALEIQLLLHVDRDTTEETRSEPAW